MKRVLMIVLLGMSGCASIVGYGETDFSCTDKDAGCVSTEEAYWMTDGDTPKVQVHRKTKKRTKKEKHPVKRAVQEIAVLPTHHDPIPIKNPSRVMRIWIAPWEDKEGDLHMASLVYTEIQSPRWIVGESVGDAGTGRGVFSLSTRHSGVKPTKNIQGALK